MASGVTADSARRMARAVHPPARRLIVITGPSGVGKDAVAESLRKFLPLRRIVTTTTRPRRTGDRPYQYVTEADFRLLRLKGAFLEWAKVYGYSYGTTHSAVSAALRDPRRIAFIVNDPQGALTLRKLFPDALTIFLTPPSLKALENRLRRRGKDKEAAIHRRLTTARREMRLRYHFDAVVTNKEGKRTETARRIRSLIKRHLGRQRAVRRILKPR